MDTLAHDDRLSIRLPAELIVQMRAHRKRLAKQHPGMAFSLSDVARALLTEALSRVS